MDNAEIPAVVARAGVRGPDDASSLSIRDVSKAFYSPDGAIVHALDRVSLEVAAGEMVSLIGPSGCGKSTLLRLVAGLERPSAGELWVGSTRISEPSAERGLMFQNANLFPWLTVRRNIQSGLVARGLLRWRLVRRLAALVGLGSRPALAEMQRREQEVEEFMLVVGLEAFANVYPHQLSGGMAQRAALARALVNHPKILLLDEPLGALDQFTRMKMQDEVLRLWQDRGTTMLLVTHDIDEAIYMSDRIVIMTSRPGRIEQVIEVSLERPRQRSSPPFLELRSRILEMLHFAGKPPTPSEGQPTNGSQSGPADDLGKRPSLFRTVPANGSRDAEVLVIGGGPAGSALGAYLAKAGVDHLILEKAVHPRRHVGESLVCSTTPLFEEIGFLPLMEREGFVHKHGASWTHWAEPRQCDVHFAEIPELGINQTYTYHVDRARFDKLLLEHAQSLGSRVLQGAHVEHVDFGPDGAACGVTVQHEGRRRRLRGRLIVDCSGRNTILGAQLKLKRKDPLFNQFAVHGWFEGLDRGPVATSDFIHIHILPVPRGWAWQIPISATVTSIGVVTEGQDFVKAGEAVEAFFARQVAGNPVLAARMAGARRVNDLQREGNYSYVMDRFAGDGWLLVGDAARFVDPVFASGVSVALTSARMAAGAILDALKRDDLRAASFASYEETVRQGVDVWREFILLYYRLPHLFLDLISQAEERWEVIRLLQGDVYDRRTVRVLRRMRDTIRTVENDPVHPWRPYLGPQQPQESATTV
jgi:ABC-type nitrate/sulfonate/bicarbonate transport system ATPase subunit/flavin-dependent dehydrogenase